MSILNVLDAYGQTSTTDQLTWLAAYAAGYRENNYPMPAIPLAVAIHADLVQIAEVIWIDSWLEFELLVEYEKD